MRISIDAATLRDALKAVSGLVSEVKITIKTDGLGIAAMDKSNCAMVVLNMPKTSAIEWETEATGEMDEILALDLTGLNSVLTRAGKSDIVTLTTDGSRLEVVLTGNRRYKLALLDLADDKKPQKMPELTHKFGVTMATSRLVDAIDDCAITGSESISFVGTKQTFMLRAEGDTKLSIAEVTMQGSDVKIETEEEKVQGIYSVEYLGKIAKKFSANVKVKIGNEYPLVLDFKADKFSLTFILAPRVNSD